MTINCVAEGGGSADSRQTIIRKRKRISACNAADGADLERRGIK